MSTFLACRFGIGSGNADNAGEAFNLNFQIPFSVGSRVFYESLHFGKVASCCPLPLQKSIRVTFQSTYANSNSFYTILRGVANKKVSRLPCSQPLTAYPSLSDLRPT